MAASTTQAEHAAACDLPDLPEDPLLHKATFDSWRYKHYFEFVEREENTKKIVAREPWSNMNVMSNVTNYLLQRVIM